MPNVALFKQDGSQIGEVTLNEEIFGIEPNESVVYDAIIMQRASLRQGTHAVKNRSAVRGGGRKPWRQKGTGRARQGSTRSPQWKGGGVVFAPKPRDYSYAIPKKVKRLAMKSVLTSKALENKLIVVDEFAMDAPKTKDFMNVMSALNTGKKPLIITAENAPAVVKSGRNIPGVKVSFVNMLNVYDIVNSDTLVITRKAVEKVEEVYA